MHNEVVVGLASECGFELAGVAGAEPLAEMEDYRRWVAGGMAGEMRYLTGRRGEMRADPRTLLEPVGSIICVGKLYNTAAPYSTDFREPDRGWISRYAWGEDYHEVVRRGLEKLAARLSERAGPFQYKICVDTAPILERALARRAGLGWIGKNTCLINQQLGSWLFLGELLVSLEIPPDAPGPERCGTCTRCIDACPTQAIVAPGVVDARRCISYLTIECRGEIPEELQRKMGHHVLGCDICQDVCPWNRRAPVTEEPAFQARHFAPRLEELASVNGEEFRRRFRRSPVLRNVAVGLRNAIE